MINDNVLVAAISALGGIISSYLAYKYNQRRSRKRTDSTFSAIEGYEKLLRDQQHEIGRKSDIIDRLDREVEQLQGIISTLKTELADSQLQNNQLRQDLAQFRSDYNASKGSPS